MLLISFIHVFIPCILRPKIWKILSGLPFVYPSWGWRSHPQYLFSGQCGRCCEGSSVPECCQSIGEGSTVYQAYCTMTTLLISVHGTKAAGGTWGMGGEGKDAKKYMRGSWRLESSMALSLRGLMHECTLQNSWPHACTILRGGWEVCKLRRACKAGSKVKNWSWAQTLKKAWGSGHRMPHF